MEEVARIIGNRPATDTTALAEEKAIDTLMSQSEGSENMTPSTTENVTENTNGRMTLALDDWVQQLKLAVVDIPANGSCYYYAIHGAKTVRVRNLKVTNCKTNTREANYYRRCVNEWLAHHLEAWIGNGTVMLEDLCHRYGLPMRFPDNAVAINRIYSYLYEATRVLSDKNVGYDHWKGTEEILATTFWIRLYLTNSRVEEFRFKCITWTTPRSKDKPGRMRYSKHACSRRSKHS